jgi:hypothetical protein
MVLQVNPIPQRQTPGSNDDCPLIGLQDSSDASVIWGQARTCLDVMMLHCIVAIVVGGEGCRIQENTKLQPKSDCLALTPRQSTSPASAARSGTLKTPLKALSVTGDVVVLPARLGVRESVIHINYRV